MERVELGEHVLEVGPGYGATTDVLAESVPHLTAVEIDDELAKMLRERFEGNTAVEIIQGDATALDFVDAMFSGAVSFTMLHHVPTAELQDRLFAEVARVLRGGGVFVASDSLGNTEIEALHEGDTYNPVDPSGLAERLRVVGVADVDVKQNEFGWAVVARKPLQPPRVGT
jgi:ubiquinone/menaquinone biosynthesis C-methylase UbiE